jgi:hypothetical protein
MMCRRQQRPIYPMQQQQLGERVLHLRKQKRDALLTMWRRQQRPIYPMQQQQLGERVLHLRKLYMRTAQFENSLSEKRSLSASKKKNQAERQYLPKSTTAVERGFSITNCPVRKQPFRARTAQVKSSLSEERILSSSKKKNQADNYDSLVGTAISLLSSVKEEEAEKS